MRAAMGKYLCRGIRNDAVFGVGNFLSCVDFPAAADDFRPGFGHAAHEAGLRPANAAADGVRLHVLLLGSWTGRWSNRGLKIIGTNFRYDGVRLHVLLLGSWTGRWIRVTGRS